MSAAPRAIVEILWGPLGGRRTVIEPGAELRVGRADPAGLVVPHDRQMSGLHFALSWDGARGKLRDLEGAGGTWLDGQQVKEGEVARGSWIRAGDTVFRVHVEGTALLDRAALGSPEASPEAEARRQAALAALRSEPGALFAVLDAARDAGVLALLRTSVEEHQSLYDGEQGQLLAEAAPYLVALPRGEGGASELLGRLVAAGWGRSWGAYLICRRPFVEVRRQLRRILMVDVEGSGPRPQRAYFRFYDPRVLRAFLPMATGRQREETFGDVERFVVEGEDGGVLSFTKAGAP